MTKLLTWACVLALTPVMADLVIRTCTWVKGKTTARDVLVP